MVKELGGSLEIDETWCKRGRDINRRPLWSFVLQQMASQRNQVQRQQALALMCRFVCSLSQLLRHFVCKARRPGCQTRQFHILGRFIIFLHDLLPTFQRLSISMSSCLDGNCKVANRIHKRVFSFLCVNLRIYIGKILLILHIIEF